MEERYPAVGKLQDDLLQKAKNDTLTDFDVQLHKDFLDIFQKLEHYEELMKED